MASTFLRTFQKVKGGDLLTRPRKTVHRMISTSPKKNETSTDTPYPTKKDVWVSYGFSHEDKNADRVGMHMVFFVSVTISLVFGGTIIAFAPDPKLKDWARREAYLQLRSREEKGLPPIDQNLIDPATIVLPTDEELGDTEIIV